MNTYIIDPAKGYRKEHLWLPRSSFQNLLPLKGTLTFPIDMKPPVHAYEVMENHILVPREYLPYEDWERMDFEIEDHTPTEFQRVEVKATSKMRNDIQKEAFAALLEGGNGIVSLACGLGKTVISLVAWTKLKVPALVVVHTTELMNQWVDRILEHTNLQRNQIGWIKGKKMDWEAPIVVASIRTLADRIRDEELPEGFEDRFGVVIYDEVHHLGAPYFNTTATIGKGLRWGLSATPSREDGLDVLYQYHIGPVLYRHLDHDIIPETYFYQTGVKIPQAVIPNLKDRTGELNIPKLLTYLSKHDRRNEKIKKVIEIAQSSGRRILALTSRVDHINELHAAYPGSGKIHGKVSNKNRDGVLDNHRLVFASTQIAKEGLDRKDLDTLMLLLPITREGMFRQILGRIQRHHDDKNPPVLIVFEDEHVDVCYYMCQKLRRHLRNMGYPYYIDNGDG